MKKNIPSDNNSEQHSSNIPKYAQRKNAKPNRRKKRNHTRKTENTSQEQTPQTPKYNFKKYKFTAKRVEEQTKKNAFSGIRLNRFIANAGVCSRREADKLIQDGKISVNGNVIKEMGYKVRPKDIVRYGNKELKREKLVYLLLNKPKDCITTLSDPEGRKTVMDLVKNACKERIFPVGRLDRNTTGLLLLTNDGELSKKLSHPSHNIKKIYRVELDKPITKNDFETLLTGVELDDGVAIIDKANVLDETKQVLGVEIHSGRNRIVRRIFEKLGYQVQKLDRTMFAGLTKSQIGRGDWRFLTEKEVLQLKFFT